MIARQGFTDDKHIDPVRRSLELFNDFRILDSHISAGFNDFLKSWKLCSVSYVSA